MDRMLFAQRIFAYIVAASFVGLGMPLFVYAEEILFTQEEQAYLRSKGVIQAASLEGTAPLQYQNAQGEIKGISINILKEIELLTGLAFEYTLYETVAEVFASDSELIFGVSKEYQPPGILLSTPYLHSEAILFYNSALDLKELRGKRFAMIAGGTVPEGIEERDILYYNDREATIRAVNEGEADYGYSNSYSLLFHTLQNGYDNVITIPQKQEERAYCLGVHEGDALLLGILNKAIEGISESRVQSLTLFALAELDKTITPHMVLEHYGREIAGLSLLAVAGLLYVAISNVRANRRLKEELQKTKVQEALITKINFHDSLTGLYNRAYLMEEYRRIDTERQLPISIIAADINGLKVVNDSFGHSEGDKVIQQAAAALTGACRAEDVVARMGGDEFVILLPQTPFETALQVMERVSDYCHNACHEKVPVSISVGCATKHRLEEKLEDTIKEADAMMYRHKLLESRSVRSSILSTLQVSLHEKDIETKEHTLRLIETTAKMGARLALSPLELDNLNLLARLHDIGTITVDERILKKAGPLTAEEMSEVKRHSESGYRIAESTQIMANIAKYILYHHERWDGKGYPHGLRGQEIPLLSRILAIADAYDAMTNERPYRAAMHPEAAMAELKRCSGTQFDPTLVSLFLSVIESP